MDKYIDFESLHLFIKVVEAGSFSQVCAKTKIPKATLSRKIGQLEDDFGAQLFVRNTRNLKLTELGRELLVRAHSMMATYEDSKSLVLKSKSEPAGLLRISAGVEFGEAVISPLANLFCEKFPKVQIELDLTGRKVDLIYEGFDLGIRIGPLKDSSLSARKIGSFTYGIFGNPKLIANTKHASDLKSLERLPTLGFTRTDKHKTWRVTNGTEERRIKVQPRISSNNYWVLMDAAKAGLGFVYMPKFLVRDETASGKLVKAFSEWHSEEIPVHFLYPAQKFLSSKVRSFIDFAIENIGDRMV